MVFKFLTLLVGEANSSFSKVLAFLGSEGKNLPPAKSSLYEARKKIGWGIYRRLLFLTAHQIENAYGDQHLFKGHPVFAIDGSKLNLPRELKKAKYRGTHKGCFYPQGMLVSLFRLKINVPVSFELSRKVAETRSVPRLLYKVPANSIVAYDRLYFSVNVLKAHIQHKVHGVFRLRTGGTLKEVTDFIASGQKEATCQIRRKDLDITIRLIRYKIRNTTYFIGTTLLDRAKYPARSLLDLYHARWGVEESFKFLKQELFIQKFHSKSPSGVKQEVGIGMLLASLSAIFSIRTGTKRRVSKGVSTKLIVEKFAEFWTPSGIVRSQQIELVRKNVERYRHQSPPGRSFPRRSRKVINRWQKSIAWEWDKKKRLAAKGVPP